MPNTKTKLEVNPEDITDAIRRIRCYVNEMIRHQKELAVKNELLVDKWSGSSCDGFLQAAVSLEDKYDNLIDEYLNILDNLKAYKDSLLIVEDNLSNSNSVDSTEGIKK